MSQASGAQAVELHAEEAAVLDKTSFGFWVYLMTDLVLFASLFAVFGVLRNATAGHEALGHLFSLPFVLTETMLLLTSSFSCGLAIVAAKAGKRQLALAGLAVTLALGAGFLGMELHEFGKLVAEGSSWRANAALSSFFTLVATHGAHIASGLLWIAVMSARLLAGGSTISANDLRRLTLLSLFWHFLDVVWIFIFTFVYLLGANL
jgi:cytochrome o ubiquinol oxidase subunit III